MAGITHETVAAAADDPEAEINKAEWNAAHAVSEYHDVTGGAAVPAAPGAGKARQYVKINGTTPNKNIRIGWLLEDGTDIVLADVTI